MNRIGKKKKTSLKELLSDSVSLPDMIAIFLGVLELIKIRKILIADAEGTLLDENAAFAINEDYEEEQRAKAGKDTLMTDAKEGGEKLE